MIAGKTLSIPIADFASSLHAHNLKIELSNGGCGPGTIDASAFAITIDGVAGVAPNVASPSEEVFRWKLLPDAPQKLDLVFDGPDAPPCVDVSISFINGPCEADHPAPVCPL